MQYKLIFSFFFSFTNLRFECSISPKWHLKCYWMEENPKSNILMIERSYIRNILRIMIYILINILTNILIDDVVYFRNFR